MQMQGQQAWAPPPGVQAPANCPPGLEYLLHVDQLLVKQQVELLEAFTGFETANKYKVLNSMNQQVFFAAEKNDCCTRQCCGPLRTFEMAITDNQGMEVARFMRPFKCTVRCCTCYCPCQLQEMEVTAAGQTVGTIQQKWDACNPIYKICDANGEQVLEIKGPVCAISCCADINFEVMTMDGTVVGKVTKQWSGVAREAFTDADNFGVNFPIDLDVRIKTVLLAAVFLIDFMFFEENTKNNDY